VIVARVDRPEVSAMLRRSLGKFPWIEVVVDRRRGERRQGTGRASRVERRSVGRRGSDRDPAQHPAFRLAQRGDGAEIYEATGPESGRCPECGALLSVEMPRFTEPPVRLELTVVHETIPPNRTRHTVELQSFSATGRVLLASRLLARTRTEPI
jgi:hypothetical protein